MTLPSASAPTPRHIKDPEKLRATFGVIYPLEDQLFAVKSDLPHHTTVRARRLTFSVVHQTVKSISFDSCNFHNLKGLGVTEISRLTFEECSFNNSFLGATKFSRCRFRKCLFWRCDLSHTEFEDCEFDDCSFSQCSSSELYLTKTQLDPEGLLKGISVAWDHFPGIPRAQKRELAAHLASSKYGIASQLYRSNVDAAHLGFADEALYCLKRAELIHRWHRLSRPSQSGRLPAPLGSIFEGARIAFSWMFLILSSGGVAISRPLVFLLMATVVADIVFGTRQVFYDGTLYANIPLPYPRRLVVASSAVLGFGYGNFSSSEPFGIVALWASAISGLVGFALLVPILVRRYYK